MQSYRKWLNEQTHERTLSSLGFLLVCRQLGQVQLESPHSESALHLGDMVEKHYRKNTSDKQTQSRSTDAN
jgi:hypothetical protein